MLYNNEDEFLKILASKISKLNPKQPSNNDWADFDMAYRRHKKKKNKRIIIIWLSLFTLICSGIYYYNTYTLNVEPIVHNVSSKSIKSEQKIIANNAPKRQEEKTEKSRLDVAQKNNNNNLPKLKASITIQLKDKNNLLQKEDKEKLVLTKENMVFVNQNPIKTIAFDINTLFSRRGIIRILSFPIFNDINPSKVNAVIKNKIIDSEGNKTLKTSNNSMIASKYLEIGLCFQNNNFAQMDYPSDHFFKGLGINTGIRLQNNWGINLGLNMMYLNQVKINKFIFQTEEHQIERIDTTIKYNSNYNRLMMQFDTVMSYKNVNHEISSVYKNNILFISIPLQARYYIGNEKHSLYGSMGVTGTFIYQSQSLEKNVGLANESSQTSNDYSFLFAPTIGLGFHQRIYKDWAFHLASNYSKYLNSNLNQSNTLQLQTGIKYNF